MVKSKWKRERERNSTIEHMKVLYKFTFDGRPLGGEKMCSYNRTNLPRSIPEHRMLWSELSICPLPIRKTIEK